MAKVAILDVDGTLVDSVYHHALTWHRAFAGLGIEVPVWRCHRHVGMGGDQLVPALAGEGVEREHGEALRAAEGELFGELIGEVRPLEGAGELIATLGEAGRRVILASSTGEEDVEHYIELLGAGELIDGYTTKADVDATKPDPDLVEAALAQAGSRDAVMVGDSVWDVEAARRAGIESIGLRCGGFSAAELRDAGVVAVFDSPAELRGSLAETPLG